MTEVVNLCVCELLQMVEISRVLQPGGVFVASTFLKTFSPLGEFLGDDTVRPLNQVNTFTAHGAQNADLLLVQAVHPSLGEGCARSCSPSGPGGICCSVLLLTYLRTQLHVAAVIL